MARREFQEGTLAYNLGHFAEAVLHYEKAYKLIPDPSLLFNIAQSYRLDGKYEKALHMYRAFLREARLDEPNRKVAEKRVDEMKNKLEERKPGPATAPAAIPVPASPASSAPPPPAKTPIQAPPALQALANHVAPEASASNLTQTPAAVSQEEIESPIYQTWWFWTGTVAVVGGVVTAVLLAGKESKGACDGLGFSCVGIK